MVTAQETVKFWRDPVLHNLELLRATYVTHTFSRHTHEGYVIALIESGVEAFHYRGALHQAPSGSLAVIHPGEVHTGHAGVPEGWTYRTLYPAVSLMQQAAEQMGLRKGELPYFPTIVHDPQLAKEFRNLHMATELSASRLERESRMLWTLAQLIDRYGEVRSRPPSPQPAQPRIQQTRAYLQAHLTQNVSLDELARLADLKPLRLLRLFRQEIGMPPHAYLVQLRVSQAKALLAAGMPIAAAALETGFSDQSHLNRHFKRLTGITPGQYVSGCFEA